MRYNVAAGGSIPRADAPISTMVRALDGCSLEQAIEVLRDTKPDWGRAGGTYLLAKHKGGVVDSNISVSEAMCGGPGWQSWSASLHITLREDGADLRLAVRGKRVAPYCGSYDVMDDQRDGLVRSWDAPLVAQLLELTPTRFQSCLEFLVAGGGGRFRSREDLTPASRGFSAGDVFELRAVDRETFIGSDSSASLVRSQSSKLVSPRSRVR